ncbi:hypothetical protein [Solirhodobacter olei]|uniref:hypothetical protein n=1 Tax=Solirhodobacter olei TaxID=2493082 RepID=UPI000FD92E22|nr:hypothetical protein [Solirhodobacter olei]
MSDRMTNTEIEDVLSSIRRLVSEEQRYPFRSERGARTETPAPATSGEPVDKLVLTPAFRIPQDPPAASPAPQSAANDDAAESPEPAAPALHDRIAVLEATVTSATGEFEPDGSEVAPSAYLSEPLPEPQDEDEAAEAPMAVSAEEEPPEPPLAFTARSRAYRDEAEDTAPEAAPAAPAAPGPATAGWQKKPEPVPQFAHHRSAGEGPEAAPPEATPVFGETEPEELDEEALREIIRSVIREELQGTLGERMTRNLRKLIRAEIKLALAGQQFGGE